MSVFETGRTVLRSFTLNSEIDLFFSYCGCINTAKEQSNILHGSYTHYKPLLGINEIPAGILSRCLLYIRHSFSINFQAVLSFFQTMPITRRIHTGGLHSIPYL